MATETLVAARTDRPTRDDLRTRLRPVVDVVAERVAAVDAGELDVRPSLLELGAAGLLGLGLPVDAVPGQHPEGRGTLADQATVIRSLARECTATAFSVWAHRTAVGYLAVWGSDELRRQLLPSLLTGERTAATAMATAFQAALGLRELTVTARPDGTGGFHLDGVIPWASNLFADGAAVVLPARTEDGRSLIVAITTDQPGVTLLPYPELLALGTTASTTVKLAEVHVAPYAVLTDRFLDFLADVRPAFLLLQTALCFGLADASLDAAAPRLTGTTEILADDHQALRATAAQLDARFQHRLQAPAPADADLVDLRLRASDLAVAATRHEAAATGGAGYLATSATARRLREAAFLPIQSPTEAQLRWELSRSA